MTHNKNGYIGINFYLTPIKCDTNHGSILEVDFHIMYI